MEDAAATVADHAFFQYERTLQRESNPELIITLPPALSTPALPPAGTPPPAPAGNTAADGAELPNDAISQQGGDKGNVEEKGNGALAGHEAGDGLRTVVLRVEYELKDPGSGLLFWGAYAHTNNQVCLLPLCCNSLEPP